MVQKFHARGIFGTSSDWWLEYHFGYRHYLSPAAPYHPASRDPRSTFPGYSKRFMAEHGKAMNQENSHTKSGADQGSAFHGSCRTRTAYAFWREEKNQIRRPLISTPLPYRCVHERVYRWAFGARWRISSLREIPPWKFWTLPGFAKSFYVIFQRDRIFLEKPISPKDIYRLSNHLSPKAPAIGWFSWINRSPKDAMHMPPNFLSQIFYPYA